MNWTKLIIGTTIVYIIYYIIIIVMDLVRTKKGKENAGYEVINMEFEDEDAEVIKTDVLEEPFADLPKSDKVEIDSANVELGEIEMQGLPVDDFVKAAKEMSSNVEF